jgi:DNA-binding SARP family transcriptional activator/TolB-like protein
MLRDNRFRLITLGRLTLVGAAGEEDASLARRRLKLAVLAVLSLARRPMSRDTLLGLFWAEHDEPRARHSLSNALSSLRGALGERSITTRDAEVALDPSAPLDVDAIEFSEAIESKDHGRAVHLYDGPFLEGFHVDDSPAFEQWVSRERRRLEAMFLKACAEHCASLARSRRWVECEHVARRWIEAEPLSADAAIYYLNAIKAPATRSALAQALEEFEALRTRLNHEFELAPHPSVVELSTRIREQLANAPPEPVVNVRVTAETKIEPLSSPPVIPAGALLTNPPPASAPAPVPAPRSRGVAVVGLVLTLAAITIGIALTGEDKPPPAATRPVIAVLSLPMRAGDSSTAWLSEGLPQMIDTKLANVAEIDVVPPVQVRAVIRRTGRPGDEPVSVDDARDLGRRVGASHVVHGWLARDREQYVLDLSIHDVRSGSLVRNVVLSAADPLGLADQAAARVLGAANVSLGGPRLMDLETSSLEAYQHFIRAQDNAQAGRLEAAARDIDAAIALDSGFIPALRFRLGGAIGANDTALTRRLRLQIQRNASRATQFDRLEQELWDAYYAGEQEKSAALARGLVRRYPRDPRAYHTLESILLTHGAFEEAERVAIEGLSLDSLAIHAGKGPCSQCIGFYNIISMRWVQADYDGAAAWSRRWIDQQPDAPSAWTSLAWTLSYAHKLDSALAVMERALTLAGNEMWVMDQYARMLIINRRYAQADSVVRRIGALYPGDTVAQATDLRQLLAREAGRPLEANRIIERHLAAAPASLWGADLIQADNRRLAGEYASVARTYEQISHGETPPQLRLPLAPGAARAFCWHHALAGDALGMTGDTVWLRAIADTLQRGCHLSYYGRDWKLHHHVRGLIAMRAGRYDEAEREFNDAVWTTVEGWSLTAVELAKARLAVGKPTEAIRALRTAYSTRLDAMGRYVPISELDYWMAQAFTAAGEADSARVYTGYHERAWKDAEPQARRRLAMSQSMIRR